MQVVPKMERELPRVAKLLRESVLPRVRKSKTETLLPKRETSARRRTASSIRTEKEPSAQRKSDRESEFWRQQPVQLRVHVVRSCLPKGHEESEESSSTDAIHVLTQFNSINASFRVITNSPSKYAKLREYYRYRTFLQCKTLTFILLDCTRYRRQQAYCDNTS